MVDGPRWFNNDLSFRRGHSASVFYFRFSQTFLGAFSVVTLAWRSANYQTGSKACVARAWTTPYTRSFEQMFHLVCDLVDVSLCTLSSPSRLSLPSLLPFFLETPWQLVFDIRCTMLNLALRCVADFPSSIGQPMQAFARITMWTESIRSDYNI